jgi:transcriptional regulator with XRE-family HTH domain
MDMPGAEETEGFTLQENEVIGRNISMFRRMQEIKALDMASRMDMKLGAYSKYERGETRITIDFVKKAAEVLKVDPLKLLAVPTQNFVQTLTDSPNSPFNVNGNVQTSDPKQTELVIKLIENVMLVNERILILLEREK